MVGYVYVYAGLGVGRGGEGVVLWKQPPFVACIIAEAS